MIIEIKKISKKFGSTEVLNIPELSISKGEIVGLLGNNGAGKTTLLRLLLDLLEPTTGIVLSEGKQIGKSVGWKVYTGSYLDTNFLIDFLTPEEYFGFLANINQVSPQILKERLNNFHDFMGDEIMNQRKFIRDFSAGNKQKIGIIGSMLMNPQVLILDEPFNFLDPSSQIKIKLLLKKMHDEIGTCIIISSHNLQHIIDLSSRILLLEKGKLIEDIKNENENTTQILNSYFCIK